MTRRLSTKSARRFKKWRGQLLVAILIIASVSVIVSTLVSGCAGPPIHTENICAVFRQRPKWYQHAAAASHKWDIPLPVIMAIMQKESRFVATARPPRRRILWIFPGPHITSAYGYAQALDKTWDWYRKKSGNKGADRDDFDDAIDFVAWYCRQSVEMCDIPNSDAYHLYIAYHQGQNGFNQKAWTKKAWLTTVARTVDGLSNTYARQLRACEAEFNRKKPWYWPF